MPILSGLGLSNLYDSEPWLNAIILKLLQKQKGAFIDVGINTGQTLLKFLEYEQGHEYFGFEPNPTCLSYVEKIIEANHLEKIHLIPAGLSRLYLSNDSDSAASLVEGFRPKEQYSGSKTVTVLRGDQAVEALGIQAISVLKIDVEGGELDVIKGLAATIRKMRPCIICEILPIYETNTERGVFRRTRADEVTQFLSSLDYRLFQLFHDGRVSPLEAIQTHGKLECSDYLFTPAECAEERI